MLQIVVFDSGWGGEMVARYLEQELEVVEVIRVIDWANASYGEKTEAEICELAEQSLSSYFGKVDLIVLGGYTVSLALDYLQKHYPEQKIVGMDINFDRILRGRRYPEYVAVLMNEAVSLSKMRQCLQDALIYSTIVIPDCRGWDEMINEGLLSREALMAELKLDFKLAEKYEDEESDFNERLGDNEDRERNDWLEKREELILDYESDAMSPERMALLCAIRNFDLAARQAERDENNLMKQRIATVEEAYCEADTEMRVQPNVVVLLNTHFWELKEEIEEILGWRVRVVDFRDKLLHDVCAALKLRGVHGGRAK